MLPALRWPQRHCTTLHEDEWEESWLCFWAHEKIYLSFQIFCLDCALPGDHVWTSQMYQVMDDGIYLRTAHNTPLAQRVFGLLREYKLVQPTFRNLRWKTARRSSSAVRSTCCSHITARFPFQAAAWWLTADCNPGFRRSNAFFWILGNRHICGTHSDKHSFS